MNIDSGREPQQTLGAAETASFVDFASYLAPFDSDLLFECVAAVEGRHNAVYLYPDRMVLESPEIDEGRVDVPLREIDAWSAVDDEDVVRLIVRNGRDYSAHLPGSLRPVLEVALEKVLGRSSAA